jgi:hypothetical protein
LRHPLSLLLLLATVWLLPAAEIRVAGLPRDGLLTVDRPVVTLQGETSAARLWWSDSRGGRGVVTVERGRFTTGELGVAPGYTGIVVTDGESASAFVGVVANYRADVPDGSDILPPPGAGKTGREREGLAIQFPGGLWPRDGATNTVRIPYTLSSGGAAVAAIAAFNQKFAGQIQWVPRAAEAAYVDFALDPADQSRVCRAHVGRLGGEQKILGSIACSTAGLLHEMGHVLGLHHENQRPDAATWVNLQAANADKPNLAANFAPLASNAGPVGLYDYGSLMHYHPLSASKNRRPVLSAATPGIPFGEAVEFSAGDIDQLRRLYGFTQEQVTITTHPTGLPMVVDGVPYTSPQSFSWALGSQHTVSVPSGFQARAENDGARYAYGNWNDGLPQSHTITVTPGTGAATSPSNRPAVTVYQANFVRYNRVNVVVNGNGSLQMAPPLTNIDGQSFAVHNTVVTATPVAAAGSRFRRWAGTEPFPQGQTPKEILFWTHPWTLQADFTTDPAIYRVGAAFTNPGPPASPLNPAVSVQVDGVTHMAPQNFSAQDGWTVGSSHTLAAASPQAPETPNVQYLFNGWTTGSPQIVSLPAGGANWVAEFTPHYRGYSQVSPACAVVPGTPPVADGFYADGLTVPFAVTPASGWFFTGWSGDLTGTANPSTLVVRDQFVVTGGFNTTNVPLSVFGLSPSAAVRGGTSQLVTVNGSGFTPGSRVVVDNSVRTTTYLNSSQLRVTLNAVDLSVAGGLPVGVYNFTTSPSCGAYAEMAFEVRNPAARWAITKSATGPITQGQPGVYSISVSNSGGTATTGLVTVTELPPANFTVASLAGSGWTCAPGGATCTRQEPLGPGEAYPLILATLNVPLSAPPTVTNQATVSGGNVALNATAAAPATVRPAPASVVTLAGNGQSAGVDSLFSTRLAVTVRDANSAGVSGIAVVFTAPASGPSGTFANGLTTVTAMTGADGVATADPFRANGLAGGPYVVSASVAGVTGTASFPLTNTPGAQTIQFAPLSGQLLSAGALTVAATASSGLPVSFAAAPAGVCSVAGALVSLVAAGNCTVTATQAGDANFAAAAPVAREFAITQSNQTISFAPLADRALDAGPFPVSATATSGLTVVFQSDAPQVCSLSGTTVTPLTIGQCSIRASQAGGSSFTAAPDIIRSFAILPSGQTITFGPIGGQTLASPSLALTATASSGLAVSYQSLTPAQCSVAGATATLLSVGTCTIRASQEGNATYAPAAAVTQSFAITLATQTVTLGSIGNQTFGVGAVAVAASATSGLPVALTATPAGVCAISGSTVQVLGAGQCAVAANQAGNAMFAAAAEVVRTFTISPATQTISFPAVGSHPLSVGSIRILASATSGLTVELASETPAVCSVSGPNVTFLRAGNCQVRATQPGSANFTAAASAAQIFEISRSSQSITFGAPANQALSTGTLNLTASSTSGLPVTLTTQTPAVCSLNGTVVTLAAVGQCRLEANQAGDANYLAAAPVVRTFEISLGVQTITFAALGNQTFGTPPITLSATATSGLPVSFAGSTPAVCTVAGSTLTIIGGGTCVVQASQGGNASFAQAAPVVRSFTVAQAPQTIAFAPLPPLQFGASAVPLTATATSGLAVSFTSLTPETCTVSGATLTTVAGGNCDVQARQAGDGNYLAAAPVGQTVAIAAAAQSILFVEIPSTPFSTGSTTANATASSGLAVTYEATTSTVCRVVGATVFFLATGGCQIRASQAGNASYLPATAELNFLILQASQSISFAPLPSVLVNGGPLALSATATSGLPVTFVSLTPAVCTVSGSLLQLVRAGLCSLEARQAGNSNYGPAIASQSLSIGQVAQTITFALPAPPWTLVATASSGLAVTFTSLTPGTCGVAGNQAILGNPGLCTIQATQPGNENFTAAPPVSRSFTVAAPAQTITFQTVPPGMPLEVNGLSILGGTSLSLVPGTYPMAALNPPPANGTRQQFVSWTHGGAQGQTITVGSGPTTYIATYSTSYLLTMTAGAGGSVTPATGYYPAGAVQVTASPNLGFTFQGFTGALTGATNPQTLQLTGPAAVQAAFGQVIAPPQIEFDGLRPVLLGHISGFRRDTVTGELLAELVLVNYGAGTGENTVLQTVALGGTLLNPNQALGHFRKGQMRVVNLRLPGGATGTVLSWSGVYDGGTFSGFQSARW